MSNFAKKLIELASAKPEPAPITPDVAAVTDRVMRGVREGGYIYRLPAKHGVPDETRAKIGERIGKLPEVREAVPKLKKLQVAVESIRETMKRIAEKSPAAYLVEHLEELSGAIAGGRDLVTLDGFTEQEWAGDRQSKLDAGKRLLIKITQEAAELAKPILAAGYQAAQDLLAEETDAEAKRYASFGLPYEQPSQILLSLRDAAAAIKTRLDTSYVNAASWAFPRHLVFGLVEI